MGYYQNSEDKTSIVHEKDKFQTILRKAELGEGEESYDSLGTERKAAIDEAVNAKLMYHTNRYGQFIQGSTEKWATYTGATGDPTNETSLNGITAVTLWAYNKPRDYKFVAHYTAETIDNETEKPVIPSIATVVAANNTGIYIEDTGSTNSEELHGFYNQRVGRKDDRENINDNYGINSGVPYLEGRGIVSTVEKNGQSITEANAYFSTKRVTGNDGKFTDYTDYDGFEIKAPLNATTPNGTEPPLNLVFDGWYVKDYSGYHRVSTDRSYMNRVIADTEIYAGYRLADAEVPENQKDKVKVSITQNENDYYIAEDGTKMVRFNTQLNVSGADEKDKNIRDVAVLYMNLPTVDSSGNAIVWTEELKNTLSYKIQNDDSLLASVKTHLTKLDTVSQKKNQGYAFTNYHTTNTTVTVDIKDITTTTNGKIICYAYEVVESDPENKNKIALTNKNRMQFTWDMTLESYETRPFLAFAAIKYDDDESDYVIKGSAEGADAAGANWIVSTNFVSNMINTKTVASSGTADVNERKIKVLTQYAPSMSSADIDCDVTEENVDNIDNIKVVDLLETVTEESDDSEAETVTDEILNSNPETVTDYEPVA